MFQPHEGELGTAPTIIYSGIPRCYVEGGIFWILLGDVWTNAPGAHDKVTQYSSYIPKSLEPLYTSRNFLHLTLLTVDLDPTLNAGKGRTVQRLRPNTEFQKPKKFSMASLRE